MDSVRKSCPIVKDELQEVGSSGIKIRKIGRAIDKSRSVLPGSDLTAALAPARRGVVFEVHRFEVW